MNKLCKLIIIISFFVLPMRFASATDVFFPVREIESIANMKPEEIIIFASNKNVELYKFEDPNKESSKNTQDEFLALLPLVNYEKYNNARAIFNGTIMGVYFSRYNSTIHLTKDTIIFSDQADKWTILHEFAHALIDQDRSVEMKKDEAKEIEKIRNAKEDYEEVMAIYRSLGFFPSKEHVMRAYNSLKSWCELMINFLYNYELEEIRIEKFLQSVYREKPLVSLNSNSYRDSFWYIRKNCHSARQKMNHAKEVLEYFLSISPESIKNELMFNVSGYMQLLSSHEKVINLYCPSDL